MKDLDPQTEKTLRNLFNKQEQDLQMLAGVHYVTFRKSGGFGVRVSACLAATTVLQKEVDLSDPGAYVKRHAKLVEHLKENAEPIFQQAVDAENKGGK